MVCTECGKVIGTKEVPAYEVRMGYVDSDDDFEADQDVGHYCSECLKKGV